jgi:hypothetical protein
VKNFYWDNLYLFKYCPDQIFQRYISDNKVSSVIKFCDSKACGGHFSSKKTTVKILQCGFYWPTMFRDKHVFCKVCENCQKSGFISKQKEYVDNLLMIFRTYPSGNVHWAFHDLWSHFHEEHARCSLENLTIKDPVCQFLRKLDGKPIIDP